MIMEVDAKSKPYGTTRSLVLDNVKSQATRSLTQAVIFPCGLPRASILRDLGAQANSGCSWISAQAADSVRRNAEPCKVRVSATWNELDTQWYGGEGGEDGKERMAHQKKDKSMSSIQVDTKSKPRGRR
jgi:hypothetical protein